MTSATAQRVWEALGGGITGPDEGNGLQLQSFLDGLLSGTLDTVDALVRDAPNGGAWASLVNPDLANDANVAFVGQFVGVALGSMPAAQARTRVRNLEGWARGGAQAIINAVKLHLTGAQNVFLIERFTGDPYLFKVQVYTWQIAAGHTAAMITTEIERLHPAGVHYIFEQLTNVPYSVHRTSYATYAIEQAAHATYAIRTAWTGP